MKHDTRRKTAYSKEIRATAKELGAGLLTIAFETPDGETKETHQIAVTPATLRASRWWLALVLNADLRPVPDLEEFLKEIEP